jgi:hypothetical protein
MNKDNLKNHTENVYDYALILSAMKPNEWVREFAIVEPY